jgi:hypothetical protein
MAMFFSRYRDIIATFASARRNSTSTKSISIQTSGAAIRALGLDIPG